MLKYAEQIVWEKEDAEAKLKSMDMDSQRLVRVAAVAIGQANNVTGNFALNAWGTFAHHYGLAELRNQFAGPDWKIDRSEGIESIVNEGKMLKVTFQNVDVAMGKSDPKPRSPKGAGAERACEGNLGLFPDAPIFVPALPTVHDRYALWSLMVDEAGNLELSRPVVEGGTFKICRERILIADAEDWLGPDPKGGVGPESGDGDDYEVKVSRKK